MREMIYRNLSSPDRQQRDLTLAEVREDQGTVTQLEKRYTYRVRTIRAADMPEGVLAVPGAPDIWELRSNPAKARQIFVRKIKHANNGVEDFTYKIVGSFYAIQGESVYFIIYRHILHMAITDKVDVG